MNKAVKIKLVKVSRIKISDEMKATYPKAGKLWHKYTYYLENGRFESKVVLDKYMVLKDGYTTYLLAKLFGVNKLEVTII